MRSALVLVLLLLAGCSDPGPASQDGEDDATTQTGTGDVPEAPRIVTLPAIVPVSWDGHTKEGAWVCAESTGTGQCMAGQQVQPDGGYLASFAYEGNLTGIAVNMTWQADPSQPGLILAVYANTSAGRSMLTYAQGPSPLAIDLDADALVGIVADNAVVFMVWPQGKTPTSPSVFVDATQQAFTVEGRLSALVEAPVAPA